LIIGIANVDVAITFFESMYNIGMIGYISEFDRINAEGVSLVIQYILMIFNTFQKQSKAAGIILVYVLGIDDEKQK
jgi:hypothetical protein